MFTGGTVQNFQSVHTVGWDVKIGGKSGLKDVSSAYPYTYGDNDEYVVEYIDTKASEKLTSLLTNATHLKDMTRLSGAYQMSSLESFHNVVINFAPKAVAFSYKGMKSR